MKKWIIGMGLLWCAGLLCAVGAYVVWMKVEDRRLRAVQASIKDGGLPSCAKDLFPQVPPEERNAAPLLKRATEIVKQMPKDSPALRCYPGAPLEKKNTARLPESEREAIRSFGEESPSREVLQLLTEAARKEGCYFDRDYARGAFLELPDLASMLRAAPLLLNHSWWLSQDGDVTGAVSEIRSGMRICEFYRNDPLLISWLVGVSCEQMCLSATMNLLAKTELTPRQIEDLERCRR